LLEQLEEPVETDEGFEELEHIEVTLADLLLDSVLPASCAPEISGQFTPPVQSTHLLGVPSAPAPPVQSTHLVGVPSAPTPPVQSTHLLEAPSGLPGQSTSSEQVVREIPVCIIFIDV